MIPTVLSISNVGKVNPENGHDANHAAFHPPQFTEHALTVL